MTNRKRFIASLTAGDADKIISMQHRLIAAEDRVHKLEQELSSVQTIRGELHGEIEAQIIMNARKPLEKRIAELEQRADALRVALDQVADMYTTRQFSGWRRVYADGVNRVAAIARDAIARIDRTSGGDA